MAQNFNYMYEIDGEMFTIEGVLDAELNAVPQGKDESKIL